MMPFTGLTFFLSNDVTIWIEKSLIVVDLFSVSVIKQL